jgi:hypothetical protein
VGLGTSERVKQGRQHSTRIVRCAHSTDPLGVGRPARIGRWEAPIEVTVAVNSPFRNSLPLSVESASCARTRFCSYKRAPRP